MDIPENVYLTISYSVVMNNLCDWLRVMDEHTFHHAMDCMPAELQLQLYSFFRGDIKRYQDKAFLQSLREIHKLLESQLCQPT